MSQAHVTCYFGKSGTGKTRLATYHLAREKRVLLHDINCEPQLAEGAIVVSERAELLRLVEGRGRVRICWRGYAREVSQVAAFEWANRCAWAGEGFAIFWDEVDRVTSAGRLPPHAYQLINAGRHRRCTVYAATRRPFRMPRDLTAAATRICALRITSPPDIEYLAEFMGRELADRLPGLGDWRAIDWTEAAVREKKSPFR